MSGRRSGTTLPLLLGLVIVQSILVSVVFSPGAFTGGDNAAYVALADALVERGAYVETWEPGAPNHTKYPPVFPALLALLVAFGAETWVTLKLVSAVAAVGVTAATFLWVRRRLPEPAAVGVALVTGLSPTLLYHSRYILSDVPFLLFLLAGLAAFEGDRRWGAGRGSEANQAGPNPDPIPVFARRPGSDADARSVRRGRALLAAGLLFVLLACLTRTAGLPLFAAVLVVLALRRAWVGLITSLILVGGPLLLWMARSGSEQGRYGSEFFLVNPYDPGLGTIGAVDLVGRVVTNAQGYIAAHLPAALAGLQQGDPAAGIGGLLVILAVIGWIVALRRGPGVVEVFTPLYIGLVLVWPEVWSGDRFALPLVPILLVYAVESIGAVSRAAGPRVAPVAQGGFLLLMGVAAFGTVGDLRAEATRCREAIEATEGNPWGCGGAGMVEFVRAARWSGGFLPDGAVVLSRKPRIFHVESGLPSRTFPFEDDPEALFRDAEAIGASYIVFDRISAQAARFVGPAVLQRPERFCAVNQFRIDPSEVGTQLLGILPVTRPSLSTAGADGVRLASCPSDYLRAEIEPMSDPVGRIPILRNRSGG